jgi:pyruvate/2-oxoglutarate/acetoin dehydrogenase E1 component/TPP-dependent pyruvate/acetoin dehydrogenase alpha subunit
MNNNLKQQLHYSELLSDILSVDDILDDYRIACISRQLSLAGRKEVHNGRAKFGIFGDGKEVAQIAYARFFRKGDWRSGYYRDQSFMLRAGLLTPDEFFAQLYGNTDSSLNPSTAGRNFNNHFATPNILSDTSWVNLIEQKNSCSDISSTGGQMPRLLGLAYASKLFRNAEHLWSKTHLTTFGNEVAFGSIGDASTSEGVFFEAINAAGVLQVPMAVAIWDDGYGISVPVSLQTAKGSISIALAGFKKTEGLNGVLIYSCAGWDYAGLLKMFKEGIERCRNEHVPVIFHIVEMTQPMGHSSSGSHERYKSPQRLQFEKEFDPILKMREWIISEGFADPDKLECIEAEALQTVKESRARSFDTYIAPYKKDLGKLAAILAPISDNLTHCDDFTNLKRVMYPQRSDILSAAKRIKQFLRSFDHQTSELDKFIAEYSSHCSHIYNTKLYAENPSHPVFNVEIKPQYDVSPKNVTGSEIINRTFDSLLSKYPMLLTFGEDTGKLGDVNGSLKGLQQKYGEFRVTDTGIREATIIGQGIGLALRGFRPIAEIQYLDYLAYALYTLTDDLASLFYRTHGTQIAPLIVRTRGHRLIGIWHSGSPLGMMLNSLRGLYICVPRNMTQAAGLYHTLLEANSPSVLIETLKAYDYNEPLPLNLNDLRIPLGVPEIVHSGSDVTLVTYGWCVTIAQDAIRRLEQIGIYVELIDVRTLLPFDNEQIIKKSISKTHKLILLDEDVPGGATAYMMQKIVEEQEAFYLLDAPPRTLTAAEHRPAYDTDGDYFSKPSSDDVFDVVYRMMHEYEPREFPL